MKPYVKNSVQKMRMERGVTQEELATKIEVSRQTIIAIERGHYTPSVLLAIKIARFFKVSVEELFTIAYEK
jgi:putative transcriptional regulator